MGKAMTKGALTKALATEHDLKQKVCSQVLNSFVAIATQEVKKMGIFTIPGVCRIKTRTKPATKAGSRMIFGKETKVKAKPARKIVKAYPVAALKNQIQGEESSCSCARRLSRGPFTVGIPRDGLG